MLQGEQPHQFTDQEQRPMAALAQQVAVAMQSRLLFEQMQRSREQLSEALRIASMGYIELDFLNQTITLSDEYYVCCARHQKTKADNQLPLAIYSSKIYAARRYTA